VEEGVRDHAASMLARQRKSTASSRGAMHQPHRLAISKSRA